MGISLFHNDRVLRSHLDVAVDQVDVGRVTIGPLVPGWLAGAVPVMGGGAVLVTVAAALAVGGIEVAALPSLFVATASLVWMALALDAERLRSVLVAAAQLPLATALLYAANAGAIGMNAVYGLHALVVLVMLADRGLRADVLARAWWGAELVALVLWLL